MNSITDSVKLYNVAVAAPIDSTLTYSSKLDLLPGDSVKVPLGSRQLNGVVITEVSSSAYKKLKSVIECQTERPSLSQDYIRWLQWLASYYFHPIGQVCDLMFPPLAKRESKIKSKKTAVVPSFPSRAAPTLTEEQQRAIKGIQQHSGFAVHLLFGVTGSGKTEVYLQLLQKAVAAGQSCLVLVPEISLTPQLIARFAERFPDQIAVIHSHLTDREKTNQWWLAHTGQKKILVGARSALFCPMANLGFIILDEEHESSFKQDEKLKYHARDSALMLAKIRNIPVVLGSATPSLETYHRAMDGHYQLHQMKKRAAERHLPQFAILDLRQERADRRDKDSPYPFWLSVDLYNKIHETLQNQEQVALFLNRRGMAQLAICESCGHTAQCPNCAISLTVHHKTHLVCHYCDYTQELKFHCPACKTGEVKPLGLGTEKVQHDIAALFPQARTARADRDEIRSREDLDQLIRQMEKGQIDILIGTQMIAKGLDFPKLTTVGLVLADVGFHLPDFRATERSFQLLVQVGGRSGRHSEQAGSVIVQTYDPHHVSVEQAVYGSYEKFAANELAHRRALNYPPFGKLGLIRVSGLIENTVAASAERLVTRASHLKLLKPEFAAVQVLGPAPSPLAKLRSRYRFQCLVKSPDAKLLNMFCRRLLGDRRWITAGIKIQIDIDPINMM